jgi:hypothetical protein
VQNPIIGFPGHWAPNDSFYEGEQFPNGIKTAHSLPSMALPIEHHIRKPVTLFVLYLLKTELRLAHGKYLQMVSPVSILL